MHNRLRVFVLAAETPNLFLVTYFKPFLEIGERSQTHAFILANPAIRDFVDGNRIEVVELLASAPDRGDEIRSLEDQEMFGDRLSGHVHLFAEFAQGLP